MEKTDVLIIGAGPAGTVAAAMVHKNGLKVKIVEKQQFPRFVIGESLLPKCMEHLEEAGFLETIRNAGFLKKVGAKFLKDDLVCEFDFSEQHTKGWEWTWQVPRSEFDNLLVNECINRGIDVAFERAVTDVQFHDDHSIATISTKDGSSSDIQARYIIDASGYGRVLPRLLDLNEPSLIPPQRVLFAHVGEVNPDDRPDSDKITYYVPHTDLYFWVIPFSNGNTSVGFVGNPAYFEKYKGTDEENLRAMINDCPHIQNRFGQVQFVSTPTSIFGPSIAVKQLYGNGYVLTGNATEFIDPIFSSGVTFAMESGILAGKTVSRMLNGEDVDWQKEYVEPIRHGISTFRAFVETWYDGTLQDLFFAPKVDQKIKNKLCSVLAGYVWDMSNPFVRLNKKAVRELSKAIKTEMTT